MTFNNSYAFKLLFSTSITIKHTSPGVYRSVLCRSAEYCVDSLSVTEVVAGGYERQVFTTREQNKKHKSGEHGEACQRET